MVIRARTRAALQAKRKRGERIGSVPLGYQLAADGRSLVPQEDEQRVLTLLYQPRDSGGTLRSVAAELNARGFTTRRGGVWHHSYVWLQLRRRYGGEASDTEK